MSYAAIGSHSIAYTVDDKLYNVHVNFMSNKMFINETEYDLEEYTSFQGNMEMFVTKKVREKL